MKKYLSVLAIPALMGLGSCVQDDLAQQGGLGEEVMAKISLSLPGGDIQTKAGGGTATPEYAPSLEKMRLFVSIYDEADNLVQVLEDGTEQSFADGGKYSKTIRLITGKTYKIVAWADVKGDGDKVYYEVSNDGEAGGKVPFTVSLKDMDETSPEVLDRDGNDVNNDAYFVTETKTLEANGNISLTMKRPFGLVKVTTTDWGEAAVKHVVGNGEQVSYTTTINVPTELNLLDGTVSEKDIVLFSGKSTARAEGDADTKELSYDYIFASDTEQGDLLNFEVDYANGENSICSYEYNSIPLKRNYITNVSGNILTKAGNLTIEIDPAWAEDEIDHNLTEVSSDKELQDAINEAEDGAVIVLKPGTYSDDIELKLKEGTKNITIQGSYAGNMLTRSGESGETVFTRTLFANRVNTDKVEDVKVVIDGVKFQYGGENNGVACIGNTQYNAIGELVVQNCIFVPNTSVQNNYFIATNHNAQDNCRSVIKLYNNTIGTADGTYNSYYPVRLWSVKQVEVIGNKFTVPEGFTGLQHINISNLSASADASIIVKDNTFTNGNSGVTISSWKVGEGTYANNFYTGKIEVTGNKFVNVAPNTIENPLRNNVPIFISPEYVDDDVTKGRVADHGQFNTFVVVENNTYEGYTPRENVIVSQMVNINTVEELKSAINNQMDGQTWVINEGTYDMTGAPTAQTKEPDWEYYADKGWKVSQFIVNANNINIIGKNNPIIYATSNQASLSLNGQATILVRGNNVSMDGLTVKAIQYTHTEGGNKAISAEGADDLLIKNCIIKPSDRGYGGSLLFDKDYTNKTARIENTSINGALITGYATFTAASITVKDVTVSSVGTQYTSPLSTNAANVINVESNFVTEIDNKTGLSEYIKGVPANTTIKLAAGEYENAKGVIVEKPVTLKGNGENTILKSASDSWSSLWVKKGGEGTVIDGLKVYGAFKDNGDKVSNAITIWTSNVIVKNCITMKPESLAETAKGYLGISTTYGDFTDIEILNNTINEARYGMYFNSISNSIIDGNTVNGTSYGGIVVAADNEKFGCKDVVVENNTLNNISAEGNSTVYAYALSVPGTSGSNLVEKNNKVTYASTASAEISGTPAYGFNK